MLFAYTGHLGRREANIAFHLLTQIAATFLPQTDMKPPGHVVLFTLFGLTLLIGVSVDFNGKLSWHDQQRMEQIALLTIATFGGITCWRFELTNMLARLPSSVKWAWIFGFGAGLVSVTLSAYPRFALTEWANLLLLLWLTLLWAGHITQAADLDKWNLRLVIAVAVVIAVKIMAGYLASLSSEMGLNSIVLFSDSFSNRRVFGQVAIILVPLMAYPLIKSKLPRFRQLSLFLLLSVWWMLIIVSGSRGTWLALCVASGLMAVGAWHASLPWLKLQVKAFVLGILLFTILFVWVPPLLGRGVLIENRLSDITTLSGREVIWSIAAAQIKTHPLLGVGPMHLSAIKNHIAAHPHNAALQIVSEWGIPASLALALPLIMGLGTLIHLVRGPPRVESDLAVCLLAGLVAAIVLSMVDGVIVMPYTQLWLVMITGWAIGLYYRATPRRGNFQIGGHLRFSVPFISFVGLILLLGSVAPEIMNWHEAIQRYVDEGSFLPPRYWVRGWIPM